METVYVINQTMGGTFFLEGQATVIRQLKRDRWALVDFGDGLPVERYIDPEGQAKPAAYVSALNSGPGAIGEFLANNCPPHGGTGAADLKG